MVNSYRIAELAGPVLDRLRVHLLQGEEEARRAGLDDFGDGLVAAADSLLLPFSPDRLPGIHKSVRQHAIQAAIAGMSLLKARLEAADDKLKALIGLVREM